MDKKMMQRVLETMLSVPAMNEDVRITLKLPRKQVLILVQVLNAGLDTPSPRTDYIEAEKLDALRPINAHLLETAGLNQLAEHLESFLTEMH